MLSTSSHSKNARQEQNRMLISEKNLNLPQQLLEIIHNAGGEY